MLEKTCNSDDISFFAWFVTKDIKFNHLISLFNEVIAGNKIQEQWRTSTEMYIHEGICLFIIPSNSPYL